MNKILGTPKNGWTNIRLGEFQCWGSYMTDIPIEWLKAIKYSLQFCTPLCLYADNEGTETYIIIDEYCSYAFKNTDRIDVITIWQHKENVIKQIINDIESDIDSWVQWDLDENATEKQIEWRTKLLHLLIKECKSQYKERYSEEL